ncbi:MAG TPA: TolC family protein [Balneolaceae bacterium]|nr:TolC family protein [Balneolaceae bacterium]
MRKFLAATCSPLIRVGFLTIIIALSSHSVRAQKRDSVSVAQAMGKNNVLQLTEAIQVALANNTQIKRSLLNLKDADQQVRLAWSDVLPDISGSMSYTRNLEIPVNFVPAKFFDPNAAPGELVPLQFGTDNNWRGGFSVEQTLFSGEAFVGISSSKLYKAAQAEDLRATTQQIVTQTRLAYYDVLVAREQLRLQQVIVERLQKELQDNKARQRAGLVDQYAVLQVQVELSNQEPQLTQAQYGVKQAYRQLKLVIGVPLDLPFDVRGDLSSFEVTSQEATEDVNQNLKKVDNMTPYQYKTDANIMDIATDERGDIRILEKQTQLQDRQIKAIKSRFLPRLTASYNLDWSAAQAGDPQFFGTSDTRARSQTLGLTLSLPIFQGFERSANLSIAQIQMKDLEEQKRAAIRSAKNEVQTARESLNQAIETAPARKKALDLAREGYDRAKARLQNGVGSQLDVTNSELQLRQAEANYAQMVYSYLTAKAQYDKAIGLVPFVDENEPNLND